MEGTGVQVSRCPGVQVSRCPGSLMQMEFYFIVTPTFNTKGYSDDLKTTKMDIIIIGLQPMPMEDVIETQSGIFSD